MWLPATPPLMATRVDTLEPQPGPEPGSERPAGRKLTPREWARENLFGSTFDTILTIAFGLVLAWIVYRIGRFVFVDARWEVVERNMTNLMVGSYPRDEIWRLWAALFVLAAFLGFGTGAIGAQRRREREIEGYLSQATDAADLENRFRRLERAALRRQLVQVAE